MLKDLMIIEYKFKNKLFSDNWKLILNNKLQMKLDSIESDAYSVTFLNINTILNINFNTIIYVNISDIIKIKLMDGNEIKIIFR